MVGMLPTGTPRTRATDEPLPVVSLWASRGWAGRVAQCLISTAQGRGSGGKAWPKVTRSSQSKSLPEGNHLLFPWPCPLVDSKCTWPLAAAQRAVPGVWSLST